MRHRFSIRDLGVLGAAMLVLMYIAFEIDVFRSEGAVTAAEETLELDEVLLLGGLLAVGLLIFSLRRYAAQRREMLRRMAAERQARELAYQDPLTGLANRRRFTEALRTAIAAPPAANAAHAVLLLDLNGFKRINDTYGHSIGDAALVVVAQRILLAVHQEDLVARLGGDEFAILAPHLLGAEGATSIALRILQNLRDPITTHGLLLDIGAGIGIALLPNDASSLEEALRKADIALYRAKAERRSSFCFFELEMDRHVREREQLERELRQALRQGHIEARFCPCFDLRTQRVMALEAVPSWVSPEQGEIPLARFLAVAEETGLIHELAQRVLTLACAAAAQWPAQVNLSMDILPGQLKDPSLALTILQSLQDANLAPARLELEISEHMIVHDLETTKTALAPLRKAGVRIVLDNFGTGYSSLYHMQEFKIDKVKIDRRFIENMGEEQTARVVRALAGLGQGLGVMVSAEGVEGMSADPLLKSGIQQGQTAGHFLSAQDAQHLFAFPA